MPLAEETRVDVVEKERELGHRNRRRRYHVEDGGQFDPAIRIARLRLKVLPVEHEQAVDAGREGELRLPKRDRSLVVLVVALAATLVCERECRTEEGAEKDLQDVDDKRERMHPGRVGRFGIHLLQSACTGDAAGRGQGQCTRVTHPRADGHDRKFHRAV